MNGQPQGYMPNMAPPSHGYPGGQQGMNTGPPRPMGPPGMNASNGPGGMPPMPSGPRGM